MLTTYHTIAKSGVSEIVIKGSRFICSLKRVHSEDEAKAFIQAVKKEHWKATHNCSAYLIGDQNEIQRAHDDGEPSGTAGVPMLEVLKKNDLRYVAAVVTRYFGGTKLGAGGLIRAYSRSVSTALKDIGIQPLLFDKVPRRELAPDVKPAAEPAKRRVRAKALDKEQAKDLEQAAHIPF